MRDFVPKLSRCLCDSTNFGASYALYNMLLLLRCQSEAYTYANNSSATHCPEPTADLPPEVSCMPHTSNRPSWLLCILSLHPTALPKEVIFRYIMYKDRCACHCPPEPLLEHDWPLHGQVAVHNGGQRCTSPLRVCTHQQQRQQWQQSQEWQQ